jgi:hypothetical protein
MGDVFPLLDFTMFLVAELGSSTPADASFIRFLCTPWELDEGNFWGIKEITNTTTATSAAIEKNRTLEFHLMERW